MSTGSERVLFGGVTYRWYKDARPAELAGLWTYSVRAGREVLQGVLGS